MNDEFKSYVPQTLDDPPKFLLWDMDVSLVFIVMLGFGIVVGWMLIGGLFGVILAALFSRAKSGKGRGYGVHLIYWYLPVGISFLRVPQSSRRSFIG